VQRGLPPPRGHTAQAFWFRPSAAVRAGPSEGVEAQSLAAGAEPARCLAGGQAASPGLWKGGPPSSQQVFVEWPLGARDRARPRDPGVNTKAVPASWSLPSSGEAAGNQIMTRIIVNCVRSKSR